MNFCSIMEACRACLGTEDSMLPLDEEFINAYNLLTNLNVALLDVLPQYVCQSCSRLVKLFTDFRERCVTTETSLQTVLLEKVKLEEAKPMSELLSSIDIKVEPNMREEGNDEYGCYVFDDYEDNLTLLELGVKKEKYEDIKPKRKKCKRKKKIECIGPPPPLSCGLCKETFTDKTELSTHIESHRGDKKCGLCPEFFTIWPTLLVHRLIHIPKAEHKCHMCNRQAYNSTSLQYHYMTKHYDGEKTKLKCRQCSSSFTTPRKITKHMMYKHSDNCFICDHCNKIFNNKQRLKAHLIHHSENKTFVCEECGFASKHSSGLRDHKLRKHTPGKVKCSSCERLFARREDLDRHACNNVAKICPVCGVQIPKSKNYNRHLQQHATVGRYKCTRCPAIYKTKGALTAHINKHDGIRPVHCEYCPLKFYTQSVLIKHRRIHTGEKPYVCKVCQKGFTANHNLKVHMKVHGEYLVVKRNKPLDFHIFAPQPAAQRPDNNSTIEME